MQATPPLRRHPQPTLLPIDLAWCRIVPHPQHRPRLALIASYTLFLALLLYSVRISTTVPCEAHRLRFALTTQVAKAIGEAARVGGRYSVMRYAPSGSGGELWARRQRRRKWTRRSKVWEQRGRWYARVWVRAVVWLGVAAERAVRRCMGHVVDRWCCECPLCPQAPQSS
jgi:hypothetical protein